MSNYRSKSNLGQKTNSYARTIPQRLKEEDLQAISKDNGNIHVTNYSIESDYIINMSEQIKSNESSNIAVRLRNNDDVLTLYSHLIAKGIRAKYITGQDGFSLGNLYELQKFLSLWKESDFEKAKEEFDKNFKKSSDYYLALNVIDAFEDEYENEIEKSQNHFISVFEEFLKEIEFEEFERSKAQVIYSTLNKVKDRELF